MVTTTPGSLAGAESGLAAGEFGSRARFMKRSLPLHNGDAAPRRALWSRNEPVSVLGAWRNARGQEELDELFTPLAESFSDCTLYEFELQAYDVVGDWLIRPVSSTPRLR